MQERARLRRERLIEAGIDVFGRLGFAQATMRDICAQSRLSERYFYESFRNTQEVFDTVCQQLVQELMRTISGAVMQAPLNEKSLLVAGLRAFLQFIKADLDAVLSHNLSAWGGLRRWMKRTVPGSEAKPSQSELVQHVRGAFTPGTL